MIKKIYAKTKYGSRFHGELEYRGFKRIYFIRKFKPNYIRWSERAFRINTSVLPEIKEASTWELWHYMKDKINIYAISAEEALKCERKADEDGQIDIIVPFEKCQLQGVQTFVPAPKPIKAKAPQVEGVKTQSLFPNYN